MYIGEIMGVWELCPQRVPGAEPLVRGFEGRSPPEAGGFLLRKLLIFVFIQKYCEI